MEVRSVFAVAVIIAAAVMFIPASDADISDTEIFTYYELLEENDAAVYKEVAKATSVDAGTKDFEVAFKDMRLFSDIDRAKDYGDSTVQQALAAVYLSCPMVPYIWDYPVKKVEVTPSISTVKIMTADGKESTSYVVDSVSFSLTVPEGITADSIKEINSVIDSVKVTGNTDADKVLSIMSYLNGLSFLKDEEGEVSNIYDALVVKKTTSAGVSQAFSQLCMLNNIPVITVTGYNLLAAEETFSCWNYVYLEGDVDGTTKMSWYIVDPSYTNSTGIAGYLTEVVYENKAYSMSSAHYTDLTLSSPNTLTVPPLEKNSYVPVGGIPFWQKYGEMFIIMAIAVLVILALLHAAKTGNI